MVICPTCGAEVPPGKRHCSKCWEYISPEMEAAAAAGAAQNTFEATVDAAGARVADFGSDVAQQVEDTASAASRLVNERANDVNSAAARAAWGAPQRRTAHPQEPPAQGAWIQDAAPAQEQVPMTGQGEGDLDAWDDDMLEFWDNDPVIIPPQPAQFDEVAMDDFNDIEDNGKSRKKRRSKNQEAGFVSDVDSVGDMKKQERWENSPEAQGIIADHNAGGGAFLFGILALLFALVSPLLGIIFAFIAIILGGSAVKKYASQKGRDARTAGFVALVAGILSAALILLTLPVLMEVAQKLENGEIPVATTDSDWKMITLNDGRVIQIPFDEDEADYAGIGANDGEFVEADEEEEVSADNETVAADEVVEAEDEEEADSNENAVSEELTADEERYHATWTLHHMKVGDTEYDRDEAVAELNQNAAVATDENKIIVHSDRTYEQVLAGEDSNGTWTANDEGKMVLTDSDGNVSTARINSKGYLTFEGLGSKGDRALYFKKA